MKPSSAARDIELQVARLTLQSGDAVVISTDRFLNREQADQIRALVDRALPPDVRVIVLSGGLAMTVLRQGDSTTADNLTPRLPRGRPPRRPSGPVRATHAVGPLPVRGGGGVKVWAGRAQTPTCTAFREKSPLGGNC